MLNGETSSSAEHHRAVDQCTTMRAPCHGPYPRLGWASRARPWATVQPSTVRPGFSIFFIFVYYSRNLNKRQKSIENSKKYEVNFYIILKNRPTQRTWHCSNVLNNALYKIARTQALKYLFTNIYILSNTLNFCRNAHIVVSSSCKNSHN
jgi:hypothetical protein